MNKAADPCENFYEYACGGWDKNSSPFLHYGIPDFLSISEKLIFEEAKGLLNEEIQPDDLREVKLAKRYFRNCMDEKQAERDGLEPLIATLSRAGGWPMVMELGEWNEDIYLWQNVDDYYARLTGENAFHKITVQHSEDGSTLSMTYRNLPTGTGRFLIREISKIDFNREDVKTYIFIIMEVARAIAKVRGVNVSEQQLSQDIDDLFLFMVELQKAIISPIIEDHMSLFELHQWYNTLQPVRGNAKVNWLNKIMLLFSETNMEITDDIKIKVHPRYYFENLRELLQRTSPRTIVNYIHWQFISDVIQVTNKRMRKLHRQLIDMSNSYESMVHMDQPQCYKCVSEIGMFDVQYLSTKRSFTEPLANEAHKMFVLLKEQIQVDILQSEWMDEVSKNKTLEIVRNMTEIIQPNIYRNDIDIENDFKGFTVGPVRFENFLSSKRHMKRKELWTLKENRPNVLEGEKIPFFFNTFYVGQQNKIFLTSTGFQFPLFSPSRPSVINYGAIGSVIAHEINHAFHDAAQYSEEANQDYWFSTVKHAYAKRIQCFIDQFNDYASKHFNATFQIGPTPPKMSYGEHVRDENIADTMGMETALAGYYLNRKEEKDVPAQKLPGFENFTVEQLFYLSAAVVHCNDGIPVNEISYESDVHSSNRLRVIGSVSNSKNFGKSFNCPVGSPMNPETKCNIWN